MSERDKVVAYCEWGIAHASRIHYAQVRPAPVSHPKQLPLVTDCSGFALCAYAFAGMQLDTPKGSGRGFTGTLMQQGRKVSTPLPGDLFFYGVRPGEHVTIFMYEWHGAWVVCSHGQEIGPLRVLEQQELRAHPRAPVEIRSYLPRH